MPLPENINEPAYKLCLEGAKAFSNATEVGCVVADINRKILATYGYGYARCAVCRYAGIYADACSQSHKYGLHEAVRFGGKYIYYCPMGLTYFISPILFSDTEIASITCGPFLMVDKHDFILYELSSRVANDALIKTALELHHVPYLLPAKVDSLATLLFMACGFIGKSAFSSKLLKAKESEERGGQITSYIMQLKHAESPAPYPFELEQVLLNNISSHEKAEMQKNLNMILGHILFSYGHDMEIVRTRIFELLVLIGRRAVENGAPPEKILHSNQKHINNLLRFKNIEELSMWLSNVTSQYMEDLFGFKHAKHANAIHSVTQYIRQNLAQKITLEEMASRVYFSPSYLSRVFKQETGMSFNAYLNHVRIEKSKQIMKNPKIPLSDVALAVGFEDQSYYTKMFKKLTGETPHHYRHRFAPE